MKLILIIVFILNVSLGLAQSASEPIKISLKDKKKKTINIVFNGPVSLSAEGYNGDELLIAPIGIPDTAKLPAATHGLQETPFLISKVIRPPGNKPNPVISENASTVHINWSVNYSQKFLIRVPKAMHLILSSYSYNQSGKISVKNLTGELEINGSSEYVEIENLAAPLILRLQNQINQNAQVKIAHVNWKSIQATKRNHTANTEMPYLYILSENHDIDLALPADLKTSLNLNMGDGNLYSNLDLVAVPQKESETNQKNNVDSAINTIKILKPVSATGIFSFSNPNHKGIIQSSPNLILGKNSTDTKNNPLGNIIYIALPNTNIDYKNLFRANLNGGGIPIYIKTGSGNVFIRKEK